MRTSGAGIRPAGIYMGTHERHMPENRRKARHRRIKAVRRAVVKGAYEMLKRGETPEAALARRTAKRAEA